MKKQSLLITIITTLVISTLSPIYTYADNGNTYNVPTQQVKDSDPFTEPNETPGNRLPSRPLIITITDGQGVVIPEIEKEDVVSYSIYNEDGILVAMYADDIDFSTAVFDMTGVIEIRITFDGYYLNGYMEL